MKNLKAYKKAEKNYQEAEEIVSELNAKLDEIGTIEVTSSIRLQSGCSESTFLFALGVLDSRIQAGETLGVSTEEMVSMRQKIIDLYKLDKEYDEWSKYYSDLATYKSEIHRLLTNEEKFKLLEAPIMPKC